MRASSTLPTVLLGLLLVPATLGGCFKNPQPECAFACDPGAAASCPSGYTCRPDGLCKLEGVADGFACPDVSATDAARSDGPDVDGAAIDAPMIDAPMIDATVDAPIDAPLDASAAMLAITTPAPLDFGTVTIGMDDVRTVTVRNNGMMTSSALVLSVTVASDFALVIGASDTCTGQTLAPSETCTFEVRFTPTMAGARNATVTVTAVTGGMPTLAVTGTGQT